LWRGHKRGQAETESDCSVDVPKRSQRLTCEERKNQTGAHAVNGGVKKHRQKNAAICAIEEPGEHESGAEERKQKHWDNRPGKFVPDKRQMPDRPDRSQNEARQQGRISSL